MKKFTKARITRHSHLEKKKPHHIRARESTEGYYVPCPISDGTIHKLNALNSVIRFVSGIILHHSIVITVHDISLSVGPTFFKL
jgi:hypothetical protein